MDLFPQFEQYGYRIGRELGRHQTGGRVTYLATCLRTGKPVVLKQFQFASAAAGWLDSEAATAEGQILSSLDHPGIPRCLETFTAQDGFCLVQEYKDCPSLQSGQVYPLKQVQRVVVEVLQILVYLQGRPKPVIHRDIKPANLLQDEMGQVYLIDFGLACAGGTSGIKTQGLQGLFAGTLGFAAPEQLRSDRPPDRTTDLYGLGATVVCLVLGIEEGEVVGRLLTLPTEHQALVRAGLDAAWLLWLERMLAPDPRKRFVDAAQALASLPGAQTVTPAINLPDWGQKTGHFLRRLNPWMGADP